MRPGGPRQWYRCHDESSGSLTSVKPASVLLGDDHAVHGRQACGCRKLRCRFSRGRPIKQPAASGNPPHRARPAPVPALSSVFSRGDLRKDNFHDDLRPLMWHMLPRAFRIVLMALTENKKQRRKLAERPKPVRAESTTAAVADRRSLSHSYCFKRQFAHNPQAISIEADQRQMFGIGD